MQYSVGAAPSSMSLANRSATTLTALCANDISGESDRCDRFEATQPGWVSWVTIGDPAARSLRSSSSPHNITASFDCA